MQLNRNELQCLPAGLFTLPTLRTVSACHNRLVGLPVEVGAAAQLESLALHHNRLTALPDTVGACSMLSACACRATGIYRICVGGQGVSRLPRTLECILSG